MEQEFTLDGQPIGTADDGPLEKVSDLYRDQIAMAAADPAEADFFLSVLRARYLADAPNRVAESETYHQNMVEAVADLTKQAFRMAEANGWILPREAQEDDDGMI